MLRRAYRRYDITLAYFAALLRLVFGNGLTMDKLLNRLQTMVGGVDSFCNCFHTNVKDISQSNGAPDPAYLAPAETPASWDRRFGKPPRPPLTCTCP